MRRREEDGMLAAGWNAKHRMLAVRVLAYKLLLLQELRSAGVFDDTMAGAVELERTRNELATAIDSGGVRE